jgi:flagellar basal-body rod modification protein FlgD
MSTVTSSTNSASKTYAALNGDSSTTTKTSTASTDRFLTLLVAQMQNQDPLNPMDNAQMTSQMAQISTVEELGKVNTSIQSMSSQFVQMQAMQGASLVGHDVLVEGKNLTLTDGKANAAFELAGAADSVKIEVLSSAGRVVDTIDLGAETSGKHGFSWTAPASLASAEGLSFRVKATSGTNSVAASTLITDQVTAVSTSGSTLNLELASGNTVAYSAVKAVS